MLGVVLALALAAAPDAPFLVARTSQRLAAADLPQGLKDARRLADELRYEEAVVEYQRYLGDQTRPVTERAQALFELGFLHLVLGDEVSAEQRALQALELNPGLKLGPSAPGKQVAFLETMRKAQAARARVEILPRSDKEGARLVRVRLWDPQRKVARVLLRHALSPKGPFYSTVLACQGPECTGSIPAPGNTSNFTAWYFVEALDAQGAEVAHASTPTQPLQLSVVGQDPWYESPWVWGAGGAALVGIAGAVYFLSPPPPR